MGFDGKYGNVTLENKVIPADEPLFVLRGQDVFAPIVLDFYADLVSSAGDEDSAEKVRLQARRMRLWNPRKIPD